jgi:hypothetical protein
MLKTVSSITNAIGALNYKGTWDANANTPTLTSGSGTKGDYYVVSVAGSTTLDGISNWGVGDWAAYNGSVWQRVEGGADLNGVNLSVSGTSTLSGLTASTALALNASKQIVSVTNTGTGDNVLATAPTLVGDVTLSTGNVVIGTSGKGIDFSITSHPAGMTSELLADYEEGTFTPTYTGSGGNPTVTYSTQSGVYTKVGRLVTYRIGLITTASSGGSGNLGIDGLPFAGSSGQGCSLQFTLGFASNVLQPTSQVSNVILYDTYAGTSNNQVPMTALTAAGGSTFLFFTGQYFV